MKVVRIILSLILTFAIMKSCNDLSLAEPKSSTIYIILSLIFLLIPAYLIYSTLKNGDKKDTDKNSPRESNDKNGLDIF